MAQMLQEHYQLMTDQEHSQAQVQQQTQIRLVALVTAVALLLHLAVAAVVALVAAVVEVADLVMEEVTKYNYLSRPPRQKNTPNFFSGSR